MARFISDLHRTSWRSFIGRISCRIFIQMLILCTHRPFDFTIFDWTVLPTDAALSWFADAAFTNTYTQTALDFMCAASPADHHLTYMVFAEQRLLPCQSSMDYPSALLWSFPNFFLPVKTGLHIFGASSSKCVKASTSIMSFAHAVQNVCKTLFHQPRRYCVSFLNYPVILMAYNDKKQRFRCFLWLKCPITGCIPAFRTTGILLLCLQFRAASRWYLPFPC